MIASSVAVVLPFLLRNKKETTTTISQQLLSSQDASVVAITLAFSFAFGAVVLRRKPHAARLFRLSAIGFVSCAFLLLLHAILSNRVHSSVI
ncbi:hypothetical protein ABFS83_12G073200 [Erythranthe nasuta]